MTGPPTRAASLAAARADHGAPEDQQVSLKRPQGLPGSRGVPAVALNIADEALLSFDAGLSFGDLSFCFRQQSPKRFHLPPVHNSGRWYRRAATRVTLGTLRRLETSPARPIEFAALKRFS